MPSQYPTRDFRYTPEQIGSFKIAISNDRFSRYLNISKGDELGAIRQYERNTALSESIYGVLQGFEIMLRNSIHHTMIRATGDEYWFDNFGLGEQELTSVATAREKISRKKRTVTASRVVAELTFGFWSSMAGREYATTLWLPYLHKAFPHGRVGHKMAFARFTSIRQLRNMVALPNTTRR